VARFFQQRHVVIGHQDVPTPRERVEDARREVGGLFIALAPLDTAFSENARGALTNLLLFLATGMTLFSIALFLERRRHD
jgi:hypothetical protein